jgi:acyl-coenzyme A thioesterase PaaI-like protein
MSATTERGVGAAFGHAGCLLCGVANPWSFGLEFEDDGAGGICTQVCPDKRRQGYDGMLHGGVSAALLDAAMTHCLFHRGVRAVTGDLRVRYPHPVPIGRPLTLRAWIIDAHAPLYRLKAELAEEGRVLAWAQATFCQTRSV